ncbi:MAG TPA: ferritin-like domain-containing protein [Mycobacterium sp.]|nr:ferritin-like domain-containing protein [Mycobacterium sp.]
MTQQANDVSDFGLWVEHFEQNDAVHAETDAAIDFDGQCQISDAVRGPLIASVRRFQLGESGDGLQLLRKAAKSGDPGYLRAAELFVAEEQQHAALLLHLLGYFRGKPMRRHWSDTVFVRLRRLMGLRTELMVLSVAEVVALSYYGGLAVDGPDPVVRAVAARIVADEHAHVRFQRDRLRAGFRESGIPLRLLAFTFWWLTAIGATVVVALDHGPLLDAIGYRRTRFIRDVVADFAKLAAVVLQPRTTLLPAVINR